MAAWLWASNTQGMERVLLLLLLLLVRFSTWVYDTMTRYICTRHFAVQLYVEGASSAFHQAWDALDMQVEQPEPEYREVLMCTSENKSDDLYGNLGHYFPCTWTHIVWMKQLWFICARWNLFMVLAYWLAQKCVHYLLAHYSFTVCVRVFFPLCLAYLGPLVFRMFPLLHAPPHSSQKHCERH